MRWSIAQHLHKHFEVSAVRNPFGKERSIKREDELSEIEERAQRAVEACSGEGEAVFKEAEVRGAEIFHPTLPDPITSHDVRKGYRSRLVRPRIFGY